MWFLWICMKRIHTGKKCYQCDICGYVSSDKSALFKHKQIHTWDKPYECHVCGFVCNHSSSLITHNIIHTFETLIYVWCLLIC